MKQPRFLLFHVLVLSGSFIATAQAACPPPGSGLIANGTTVTETGCTITTTLANTPVRANF